MKPSSLWFEPHDFPLRQLQHRIIFVHVDSAEQRQKRRKGAWRNDAELFVIQSLQVALMNIGIAYEDIMLLSAYALQADRINGITVPASQGSEKRVRIYSMTSNAKATDASDRQSLRGDIINTAATRAQSLVLIVGDAHANMSSIGLANDTRKLLVQCPMIPSHDLLAILHTNPCNVEHLNGLLDTVSNWPYL